MFKILVFNIFGSFKKIFKKTTTAIITMAVTKPLLSELAAEQSKNYTISALVYNDYSDGRSKFDSF